MVEGTHEGLVVLDDKISIELILMSHDTLAMWLIVLQEQE